MSKDIQTYGQTDRQTHMTKLIVAFSNFAKAPENGTCKGNARTVILHIRIHVNSLMCINLHEIRT
jgi:hypothetical protein